MASLSLDRLTLVGVPEDIESVNEFFARRAADVLVRVRLGRYPIRRLADFVDGHGCIAVLERGISGYCSEQVRIDFNPSLACQEVLEVVRVLTNYLLGDVRITRMDLAVDYRQDLSGVALLTAVSRKRVVWYDRSGQIESMHVGAPSGRLSWRFYNKAREQGEEGFWWRIEAVCRRGFPDRNPFGDVYLVWPVQEGDIVTRALAEYVANHPSALKELGWRRKQKLLNQGFRMVDPQPKEVWEKEKAHLISWLGRWVKVS